ncbi:hypothetical protein V6N13_146567 [Hibiscus sabdariffa]
MVACVPPSEKARKQLRHKLDCANQTHKAAMAINSGVLAKMEIPDSSLSLNKCLICARKLVQSGSEGSWT